MADQEKLTALRCIDLLARTERPDGGYKPWQIDELRTSVRRHLRALVNPRKRKAKRRG